MASRGGMKASLGTKYDMELCSQDIYLDDYGRRRLAVEPDENCFFRAVHISAQNRVPNAIADFSDPQSLREGAVNYILDHMGEFRALFPGPEGKRHREEVREELDMLLDGVWVGYESVMAVSRLLTCRVLVTSGGCPDNPTVSTMAYYYGEEPPEDYVHVVWVSLGYYDAVVFKNEKIKMDKVVDTFKYIKKHYPGEDQAHLMSRHPSHTCQCKQNQHNRCICKNYCFPSKEFGTKIKKSRLGRSMSYDCDSEATAGKEDMITLFANKYQRELDNQDKYLQERGLKRFAVLPDGNTFFRALHVALGEYRGGHEELREMVVTEIEDNVGAFRRFVPDINERTGAFMFSKCEHLKQPNAWVGYECLMAATRVLKKRIVVTHGGSADSPDVITTAFFYGDRDSVPDGTLHVVWVSLGYYDAVLPMEVDTERGDIKQISIFKELAKFKISDFLPRSPIHRCQCPKHSGSCTCGKYRSVVSLSELAYESSYPSCSTTEADYVWDDIFTLACEEALVLRQWRAVLRRLRLPGHVMIELEDIKGISEKLRGGLGKWLMMTSKPDERETFERFVDALRQEKLNLCADRICARFSKQFL